jgi:hypothetical protein
MLALQVVGKLVVDIPKLEKMYPITDRPLLIKARLSLSLPLSLPLSLSLSLSLCNVSQLE